jgi:hypothetical protein
MTTDTKENQCLACGYKHDAVTEIIHDHGVAPREGDVSVCLNCGATAVFNADMTLRHPTAEEKAAITLNKDVLLAQITRAAVVTEDLRT